MNQWERTKQEGMNQKGWTGNILKWIAIITMLIDHTAVAIIQNGIFQSKTMVVTQEQWQGLEQLYWIMRYIGRLGFPIFCFLLVEGFYYTRNIKKYIIRLGIFALVSEIPFDFALFQNIFYPTYQNVYFTLFIGVLTLCGLRYFGGADIKSRIFRVISLLGGLAAAHILRTDYDMYGVLLIVVLYLFREKAIWRDVTAGVVLLLCSLTELAGLFAFVPIHLYNGQRGRQMKYFFYIFYPAHLLILGLITRYIIL